MSKAQILNTLVAFFEEIDWDFQWLDGMSALTMSFSGHNGNWLCYAQAREPQQQFVFYSVSPVNVPPAKRATVAEFITRANYGMIIGNFELDYDDGEVRYKTSIDVEGADLEPPLIRQMVYANLIIFDRYLPGLMSVIYGGVSPVMAVQQVESDANFPPRSGDGAADSLSHNGRAHRGPAGAPSDLGGRVDGEARFNDEDLFDDDDDDFFLDDFDDFDDFDDDFDDDDPDDLAPPSSNGSQPH